jgi:hypothetical protein
MPHKITRLKQYESYVDWISTELRCGIKLYMMYSLLLSFAN